MLNIKDKIHELEENEWMAELKDNFLEDESKCYFYFLKRNKQYSNTICGTKFAFKTKFQKFPSLYFVHFKIKLWEKIEREDEG
jgi:hypothetical protein